MGTHISLLLFIRSINSWIALDSPATTHDGPFSIAMEILLFKYGDKLFLSNGTLTIIPFLVLLINSLLFIVSWIASSTLKTPAMHAATYSPKLYPIKKLGLTPKLINNWANAYSIKNENMRNMGILYFFIKVFIIINVINYITQDIFSIGICYFTAIINIFLKFSKIIV